MNTCIRILSRIFLLTVMLSGPLSAEDIDIFAGTETVNTGLPNVIFVLDNTSNWARLSQQWPDGAEQGKSEVRAIAAALEAQINKINVGILEYNTDGNANQNDGGYVRYNLQLLDEAAYKELTDDTSEGDAADGVLTVIEKNINTPEEKRSKGNPYGWLMADFYNYLDGIEQSQGGAGTEVTLADPDGYTSKYDVFKSPLQTDNICSSTYLILIGNTESSGPNTDSSNNSDYLKELYANAGVDVVLDALSGDSGKPLRMPKFQTKKKDAITVGYSAECYQEKDQDQCTIDENANPDSACFGEAGCACTVKETACKGNANIWRLETATYEIVPISGAYDTTSGVDWNLDDWAKYLHDFGILYQEGTGDDALEEWIPVTTYTIDVFNAQPNEDFSALLFSAAQAGGGRYFQAKSEGAIFDALNQTFSDINAKASSFAAATLPLSATNRALVENEVYIGMFRPSKGLKPRWFGDLKRYQLALFQGLARLADVNYNQAINPDSGFADHCAESFWTSDSLNYWDGLGVDPSPVGQCTQESVTTSVYSDLPDGPYVEKGGVAQRLREGPAGADRTIYTVATVASVDSLEELDSTDPTDFGGSQNILDYFLGDLVGVDETAPDSGGLRPSVHGDVVHSRPLSMRYDDDTVILYYGANDGLFRAVDASNGEEIWGLVAPEHIGRIERLYDNEPLIKYEGAIIDPNGPYDPNDLEEKDYFFDGPTGSIVLYEDPPEGSPKGTITDFQAGYIYPTMRRGGRMVYGLDVSDPNTPPDLMWRRGCPNLDDDIGCITPAFQGIGQTWSTPISAILADPNDPADDALVVMFGGGFDDCLNVDDKINSCDSADKGRFVYILDALTGDFLNDDSGFATDAPVVSDVATIDLDFDGYVDYAYVADAGGDVYRLNFVSLTIGTNAKGQPDPITTRLPLAEWTMDKIASTGNAGDGPYRRFFNTPALGAFQGTVFVTLGSGDRERPLDTNYPYVQSVQNRFYAFIDQPVLTYVAEGDLDPSDPTQVSTLDLDGTDMLNLDDIVIDPDNPDANTFNLLGKRGWYLDLPDQGEQVTNPAAVGGGRVFFNTFQPKGNSGLCQSIGTGKAYAVDLFNPSPTTGGTITGGGIPIPPIIFTVIVPPGCAQGEWCTEPPAEDPCLTPGVCKKKTLCLGCEDGFDPTDIEPFVEPLRHPVFFTEDIDRHID